MQIASYVFFDLETTGLPHLERNGTKIIELSFVAALRSDLEKAPIGSKPYISKLTLLFNPKRKIQSRAVEITGISNEMLQNAPVFGEKTSTVISFLQELPKPVCLVAHNGEIFDYKILLAEFLDVSVTLPDDIICVDSLKGFRSILRSRSNTSLNESSIDGGWSELEISNEDWETIDTLCESFSNMPPTRSSTPNKKYKNANGMQKKRQCYKLTELYRQLLNKEAENAHRAEDDCMMLLECVVAAKEFLHWSDRNCKSIHDIEPLDRNKYKKK